MSMDSPTASTASSPEEQAYREASGQEHVDNGTADPGKPTTLFNIVFVTSEVRSGRMSSCDIFYATKYISSGDCASATPHFSVTSAANVTCRSPLLIALPASLSARYCLLASLSRCQLMCSACAGGALVKDWRSWRCHWLFAPGPSSSRSQGHGGCAQIQRVPKHCGCRGMSLACPSTLEARDQSLCMLYVS